MATLSAPLVKLLAAEAWRPESRRGQVRVPLRFFTAAEAKTVTAACERIFPADATGAGATAAAVVIYIDRQLAGPYGRDTYRYSKGPFGESGPEHGYQGAANPRQVYREGLRSLAGFTELSEREQIAKLASIEKSQFFALLRTHTIEGMFCDPMHGGNANLVGWKLVGFPGPQMNYRNDVDAHHGRAWRPKPASLEQITGHKPTLWEDEHE
jgi:gluconate 2-dehydrogenase gamma chain